MKGWKEPIDYLQWELRMLQQARAECQAALARCPANQRDGFRASLERWDESIRAKEEQIAAEMAPALPASFAAKDEPPAAGTPRDLTEAERMTQDGDTGALRRLWDAEARREQVYGWAY